MRIAYLSPVGVVGGAERVLLSWVAAARAAFPASHFSGILLADGPLRDRLANLGVAVTVVPLPSSLASTGDTALKAGGSNQSFAQFVPSAPIALRFVNRLHSTLRDLRPDLVHSNGLKTHLLAAVAAPRRTPVLWHLHDFYSERPVAKWALKVARRGATRGIAISNAVRRDAATVLPGYPVTTVLNTVDTQHFSPGPVNAVELDALAGLPPAPVGTVRIGLVATYANWKGHGVFLDALARLPRRLPFRGYVVGGPIYATAGSQVTQAELDRRAATPGLTGRVGFVPFQPDPVGVYRALDVVVHASTRPEPFGLTIAEAMSCGRAVVVAAAGGAIELFRDGHDGLGHSPGDAVALAGVIQRLATNPELRDRLGRTASDTARAKFSSARLGGEIAACYRDVVSRHPISS